MPSFAPILGNLPHTLVLGSMPSQISLKKQQYYANPRNSFWWIAGKIWNFSDSLNYSHRVLKVKAAGVAVWDVLSDCDRIGSLDSNIIRDSERVNDFAE